MTWPICIAAKGCLQDSWLYNDPASCLVQKSRRIQSSKVPHATRCQYSVELDIQHAGVFPQQSRSSQCNYWRPEDGVVDIWIVGAWVDISWTAAGCFGGEFSSFFFFFLGQTTNASVFQFRYLRMLHCFSPETCQTLPWSSLQWTTLMRSSHCSLWIANMMFPFTHHLVLPKNSQLLLQYDRHYWGVQDCNGYVFNWFIY